MKHYKSIDEAIEDFYHNNCINPDKYLSVEKLTKFLIIFS